MKLDPLASLDLGALGITRVGDHTGLDVLGIPVWFACRPNSRGLAVAQGKGLTAAQARLSAVMESLETVYAERSETLVSITAPLAEMQDRGLRTVPFARLLRSASGTIDPEPVRRWVRGVTWPGGEAIHAPYELVGIDYREGEGWDHDSFHMSSIGLAAHVHRDAAIRHALLEVIENDATTALELFGFSAELARPIPELPASPELTEAVGRLERAGLEARFYQIAGALALPVIGCFIAREVATGTGSGTAWSAGFACRVKIEDAALAALLEAAQSRLTDIAGAREDIEPTDFAPMSEDKLPAHPPARLVPLHRAKPADELTIIAAELRDAGVDGAYIFDLAEDGPLCVVRALVPDMQVPAASGQVRLGLTATRQFFG